MVSSKFSSQRIESGHGYFEFCIDLAWGEVALQQLLNAVP